MKNSEVQDLDRRRNAMVMDCSAVQASMELVDQPSSYEPSSYERLDIWKGSCEVLLHAPGCRVCQLNLGWQQGVRTQFS